MNWRTISRIPNLYPWHLEAACEWLEGKKRIGKFSAPFGLTKMSRVEVEEPAYLCDEGEWMSQEPTRTTVLIQGAREHNLRNITVELPRDKLVVITGVSGSGKSSLAFDTLYAEGQRRSAGFHVRVCQAVRQPIAQAGRRLCPRAVARSFRLTRRRSGATRVRPSAP